MVTLAVGLIMFSHFPLLLHKCTLVAFCKTSASQFWLICVSLQTVGSVSSRSPHLDWSSVTHSGIAWLSRYIFPPYHLKLSFNVPFIVIFLIYMVSISCMLLTCASDCFPTRPFSSRFVSYIYMFLLFLCPWSSWYIVGMLLMSFLFSVFFKVWEDNYLFAIFDEIFNVRFWLLAVENNVLVWKLSSILSRASQMQMVNMWCMPPLPSRFLLHWFAVVLCLSAFVIVFWPQCQECILQCELHPITLASSLSKICT